MLLLDYILVTYHKNNIVTLHVTFMLYRRNKTCLLGCISANISDYQLIIISGRAVSCSSTWLRARRHTDESNEFSTKNQLCMTRIAWDKEIYLCTPIQRMRAYLSSIGFYFRSQNNTLIRARILNFMAAPPPDNIFSLSNETFDEVRKGKNQQSFILTELDFFGVCVFMYKYTIIDEEISALLYQVK